jgi:hypothetical protein
MAMMAMTTNSSINVKAQTLPGGRNAAGRLGRIRALPPNATRLERGGVQSTSRSRLKGSPASGVFEQPGLATLLRLVCDRGALRGRCTDVPARRTPENPSWTLTEMLCIFEFIASAGIYLFQRSKAWAQWRDPLRHRSRRNSF